MTRQEARDAARLHIGDTGLLDYVLKSMNNVIIGGHVVRRAVNPLTRVLEYTIQELGSVVPANELEADAESLPVPVPAATPPLGPPNMAAGVDVYSDVAYLYNNVVLQYPESDLVEFAVQTILDSKHFVKEWPFRDEDDQLLRFLCRVTPCFEDSESELRRGLPPGEWVAVPLHATADDLKARVQSAMRDTYCVMERVVVTDMEEEMEDEEVIFGALESGSELWLRGRGMELVSELKYEGGSDNWTVRCRCGAEDDDGERMVACDVCETWQHTRCSGIGDVEAVPPLFVCAGCCASLMPTTALPDYDCEGFEDPLFSRVYDLAMELPYSTF